MLADKAFVHFLEFLPLWNNLFYLFVDQAHDKLPYDVLEKLITIVPVIIS